MAPAPGDSDVAALFARREAPIRDLAQHAGAVAAACCAMAARFHRGGKLIVFGTGAQCTDALHIAVEFVHPVIVGKRALPAVCLTSDVATVTGVAACEGMEGIFAHQVRLLGDSDDIALGICSGSLTPSVARGLAAAREEGMLTIALVGGAWSGPAGGQAADHVLAALSEDPQVVKEVHVTMYHLLWELVHVFFEQPGVLAWGVVA